MSLTTKNNRFGTDSQFPWRRKHKDKWRAILCFSQYWVDYCIRTELDNDEILLNTCAYDSIFHFRRLLRKDRLLQQIPEIWFNMYMMTLMLSIKFHYDFSVFSLNFKELWGILDIFMVDETWIWNDQVCETKYRDCILNQCDTYLDLKGISHEFEFKNQWVYFPTKKSQQRVAKSWVHIECEIANLLQWELDIDTPYSLHFLAAHQFPKWTAGNQTMFMFLLDCCLTDLEFCCNITSIAIFAGCLILSVELFDETESEVQFIQQVKSIFLSPQDYANTCAVVSCLKQVFQSWDTNKPHFMHLTKKWQNLLPYAFDSKKQQKSLINRMKMTHCINKNLIECLNDQTIMTLWLQLKQQ